MNYVLTNRSFINKKALFISLLISLVINFVFLLFFSIVINSPAKNIEKKEPKIKYLVLKQPKPKKTKTVKKKIQKKNKATKKLTQGETKSRKPTKPKVNKKISVPATSPVLPEVEIPSENDIALGEKEIDLGEFSDIPTDLGKIKEFKATTIGEFNPSFGSKLSEFDKTASGTAIGRKLIYRPPPPVIKTSVAPPPVKVKLWIDKDGTVFKVSLLGTTGDKKIDQKIKEYVLSWKFNEISKNQKQWAITTIRFETKK